MAGRTVVVTGAAGGIGAALARAAALRGAAFLALVDVQADAAERMASTLRAESFPAEAYTCDVSVPGALVAVAREIMAERGTPGLLCANAGVASTFSPALEEDPAALEWILAVNVLGVAATLRAFGRAMVEADEPGWLLLTGSEHALCVPHIGMASYTASKHALLGYADVLRAELPEHVGISVLCPSMVATRLWEAPRHRPGRFGGPGEPNRVAKPIMERAVSADAVAARALDGVAEGDFLILTEEVSVPSVRRRIAQLNAATASLASTGARGGAAVGC